MLRHRSDSRVAMADSTGLVRRLSVLVESIHAVVYFAPEPQSAYAELGLRGYWRGYFASRAAPLGAAGPQLVTALFGGFARAMVTRWCPRCGQWPHRSKFRPRGYSGRRLRCAGCSMTITSRRSLRRRH